MLTRDVLGLIYAELQLRCDAQNFRCVCSEWNRIGAQNNAKRKAKHAGTCCVWHITRYSGRTVPAEITQQQCRDVGEYQCGVCKINAMCATDNCINCVRCRRYVCPFCCVNGAPACLECVPVCEHDTSSCDRAEPKARNYGRGRKFCKHDTIGQCKSCSEGCGGCTDRAEPKARNYGCGGEFIYCKTCDKVACMKCIRGCPNTHEICRFEIWRWRLRWPNLTSRL